MKYALLSAVVASIGLVRAQQAEYAQCGGIGWTGGTTCVSGTTCQVLNPYYSQCLPGTASSTPNNTPTSTPPPTSTHSTAPTTTPKPPPSSTASSSAPTSTSGGSGGSVAGNPFVGQNYFLSPFYAAEVAAAAANMTGTLATTAALVAKIPTFIWFDQIAKVPTLSTYLTAAAAQGPNTIVPIVVYDLPDRDCAAAASNGEFSIANNGVANYQNYINELAAAISAQPNVRVVAVIEPDSLANLVTNLSVAKCSNAQAAYLQCINYAITKLNLPNVAMYLDAGHAGWLGWPANLQPAATLFSQVYKNASSPAALRGLATNVANYNSLTTTSPDPITSGNPNYDELLYIQALAPLLGSGGFPQHFIVEQARSGVQNIRSAWGDWCNVKGAGFGIQPTTNTPSSLIDAIVWVKPGGECDGTSNTSSPRYDYHCGQSDALQPAPEAGTWFQAYFQALVQNANPAI